MLFELAPTKLSPAKNPITTELSAELASVSPINIDDAIPLLTINLPSPLISTSPTLNASWVDNDELGLTSNCAVGDVVLIPILVPSSYIELSPCVLVPVHFGI